MTSPEGLAPYDDMRRWVVIHARPRCEKKLSDFCEARHIPVFLPMIKRRHRYGARIRVFDIPLFAGYVFVLADHAQLMTLRQNQRVANVLVVSDQETLLRQLNHIKCALVNQESLELFPQLGEGMKVSVRSGPLKGVEGFVHKIKSKTRIVLNVDFIQQAVSVEVDADWLVPV
ncbi:MAG TPA: transcription termination/antitermination NusG family protein [Kiritimatiellia bacterium]|nr:transcription termination/antitermination NusG family protein [Kiritimatiellia bacterium]HMO98951.1 transcription termination/antitermination NusG family protein [Kiritimatiellia bacterium]HMP95717.1 transcription termination/antitermination NusG family protein [Kiritimatiellia bacterium]